MFDTVGVLILVVLIALFGFLATRAWKLKNVFLRWGGVVITGLLTVIPAALLVAALRGFYLRDEFAEWGSWQSTQATWRRAPAETSGRRRDDPPRSSPSASSCSR